MAVTGNKARAAGEVHRDVFAKIMQKLFLHIDFDIRCCDISFDALGVPVSCPLPSGMGEPFVARRNA